ncbi:hypothetical protein [Nocardia mangyaensis]|uniref:hypothetical protein n=1 Tax=Nocardia mangyaensis TaxID=2213200 RepID=UPI0026753A71|nr:hypothetical protein [Nocardia mangyaensis]MDO3648268.1 hypothetical protein [Nocardia mangyaensis]
MKLPLVTISVPASIGGYRIHWCAPVFERMDNRHPAQHATRSFIDHGPGIGCIHACRLDGSPRARQVAGTGTGVNVGSAGIAL